jgi:hypothetical protein
MIVVWLLALLCGSYLDGPWSNPPGWQPEWDVPWLLATFPRWEMCAAEGPGVGTWCYCEFAFDLDGDGDVDLRDWAEYQNLTTGETT